MPDARAVLRHSGLSEYQITNVANRCGCQNIEQIVEALSSSYMYKDFIKRGKIEAIKDEIISEIDFIKEYYIKYYKEKNIENLSPDGLQHDFQFAAQSLNNNEDQELYNKAFEQMGKGFIKRESDNEWVRDFFFLAVKEAYFDEKDRRKKGIKSTINDRIYYLPKEAYYYLPKIFDENNPAIRPDINTKTLIEFQKSFENEKTFTITKKEAIEEIELTLNFIKDKYKKIYDKELAKQGRSFSSYPDSLKPNSIAYLFEVAAEHLFKKSKGNEELYEEVLNDKKREKIKNANGREVEDNFFIQIRDSYEGEIAKQYWQDTSKSYYLNDNDCLILPEIFSDDIPIIGKNKEETKELIDKVVNIIKKGYKNMYKAGDYSDLSSKKLAPLFKQGASVIYKDERGIYGIGLAVFKAKEKEPAIDENGKKVKNGLFSTIPDYFYSILYDAYTKECREDVLKEKFNWLPDPEKVKKLPKIINRENKDLQLEEANV